MCFLHPSFPRLRGVNLIYLFSFHNQVLVGSLELKLVIFENYLQMFKDEIIISNNVVFVNKSKIINILFWQI